jgi:hypothetical protein
MLLLLSILLSSFSHAEWNARLAVIPGPCTCFWDGETKNYNGKTEGLLNTTVDYSCTYVCRNAEGKFKKTKGSHKVSYATEYGNEVVCDGLKYKSQDTPMGRRNFMFVWDGITHAFDPRFSYSKELQAWGREACGEKIVTQKNTQQLGLSASYMDLAKQQAGYPAAPTRKNIWSPLKLEKTHPEITEECKGEAQIALRAQDEATAKKFYGCSLAEGELQSRLARAMATIYTSEEEKKFVQALREAGAILHCPLYQPSPARVYSEWSSIVRKARRFKSPCVNHWLLQLSCATQARSKQVAGAEFREVLKSERNLSACYPSAPANSEEEAESEENHGSSSAQ